MARLWVHAPNVHTGGGKVLLTALLAGLDPLQSVNLQLDKRFSTETGHCSPGFLGRLRAEYGLRQAKSADTVLCFGNLPPLFPTRATVKVFLQNRYLLEPWTKLTKLPWRQWLKVSVLKTWFFLRSGQVNQFIVQTQTMRSLLQQRLPNAEIVVHPFIAENRKSDSTEKHYDFLYVASGEPHKNHQRLLAAWKKLAAAGHYPHLCLTLADDAWQKLNPFVEQHQLKVSNVANIEHAEVLALYAQANALIYPSLFESFGLPLLEAQQAGLPIVASERDYVRDVVAPAETFDPESAHSIYRAVCRFLKLTQEAAAVRDAKSFLELVCTS